MDKKDSNTKAFGDQTIEFQMSEWNSFAGMDGFYFTVIEGPDFGRVFLLEKSETVLGRSDEADIQVDDEKVSRKHLKISLLASGKNEQRRAMVADLNSKNGIFINGARVYEQELRSGDKLKIGDTILKFEVKDRLDVSYHDKLYKQATRDTLTGLSNRSYFQNELRKFLSIGARYSRPFSLMMLDVDFFKKVNDTYGHDVGDNVLKTVATALMSHVRSHDVAARFGGEEFVILLPETPLNGAVAVAERIRMTVESCDFEPMGCHHHVTISIGISEFPSSGVEFDELIKRADEALYKAKESGRNRVCVAAPPNNDQ
jgi:two-component system, cell cycle response regulator